MASRYDIHSRVVVKTILATGTVIEVDDDPDNAIYDGVLYRVLLDKTENLWGQAANRIWVPEDNLMPALTALYDLCEGDPVVAYVGSAYEPVLAYISGKRDDASWGIVYDLTTFDRGYLAGQRCDKLRLLRHETNAVMGVPKW